MNPLHLIWIIPLTAIVGFVVAAKVGADND